MPATARTSTGTASRLPSVREIGEADGIFVAHGANRGNNEPKHPEPSKTAAYVTVFDGSINDFANIPTSRDVGYKYFAVFDGFPEGHIATPLTAWFRPANNFPGRFIVLASGGLSQVHLSPLKRADNQTFKDHHALKDVAMCRETRTAQPPSIY